MQFPESWLREFCNPPLTTQELADTLTMGGLEVEDLRPVAPPFTKIVVGEIKEAVQHPNADRLRVCQVDVGQGALLNIVCGAPNARVGIKVPCALVGAELPPGEDGKPFLIKLGKLRGVESQGMLCSARELKLSEDHGGLLELAADAPVGADVRERAEARRHAVHAQAHAQPGPRPERLRRGARTVGADRRSAQAARVSAGAAGPRRQAEGQGPGAGSVRPFLRPHRAQRRHQGQDARMDGRSPGALRPAQRHGAGRHLELRDVRVRPALAHLRPTTRSMAALEVRWGRPGEQLKLLNGNTVTVDEKVGVIADDREVESLAGIMGGDATAVSDDTRNVYVEAAFWWPAGHPGPFAPLSTSRPMPATASSEAWTPARRSSTSSTSPG